MKIRFLVTNAQAPSGVVRTVFTLAGQLARQQHDVEVVGVYTRGGKGLHAPPRGVAVKALVDLSDRRMARRNGPVDAVLGPARRWLQGQPSRVIHEDDTRYTNFTLLTDAALVRYLRGLQGGVVVGTRAGLNLAIARHAPSSVTRIAQEHLFLDKYKPPLRDAIRHHYPALDLVVPLTQRDAEAYRGLLGPQAPVTAIPNAVPDLKGARSPQTERVVLAAGRLAPQKGWDRLIPAFAVMAADHPDWLLRMFTQGTPEATAALHARIAKHC